MELTTLSWMLLAADRADNTSAFFSIFFIISLIFIIARGCATMIDVTLKDCRVMPLWVWALLLGFGVPMVVLGAVPSNTVIMQVAAIELGDDVLNSPEFQRILEIYIPKGE